MGYFSSSSSSSSAEAPPPLPVMALRSKIIDKIQENRVTLIVGDTGCGKSSQVPLFLLEENMEPILCTQPRRFAVVSIAMLVAKSRNCAIGGEVGYHIGHSKLTTERSRIVFKTAGVLFEEMLDKGMAALRYKVVILDEVHERSVESDLVLACVKQFMLRNKDMRVVLMSATADIARYSDYFKDLGRGERVEVLAIPSLSQQTIFQRRVLYLEQVTELLGRNSESFSARYQSGLSPSFVKADITPQEHKLIHDLVLQIHENESDISKSILVFLPTYYALEQQWSLLRPLLPFKVYILHSSIDTEKALMAMDIWKSHRKVILATNIAESSVTIPGVAFVIDSCRSLQIFWDYSRKMDTSKLVWASKSQAEQRKGRTGRTCDGQIYRLVTRSFFHNLSKHENPSILSLSLRQQVLMICCAESKAINDPKVLLQKALDPPEPEVVEDAFRLLMHIHALEKPISQRGRYEPSFYGHLLSSLKLSFDSSVLILKLGQVGLLREGILIGILADVQPLPIVHPFGQQSLFMQYIKNYFEENCDSAEHIGRKEVILMGNLCAFQFWQLVFKDKHRIGRLKQVLEVDEPNSTDLLTPMLEEEWCCFHNLVQTSLNRVSEIYNDILKALHRFRPNLLVTSMSLPSFYDPYEFKHMCLLQSKQIRDIVGLPTHEDHDPGIEVRECLALPFVSARDFQAGAVAAVLVSVVKEMRIQYSEDQSWDQDQTLNGLVSHVTSEAALCRFFINGTCNKGSQCHFAHSFQAKRPICKFFLSFQGCRNGESCFFSHDYGSGALTYSSSSSILPEDEIAEASSLLRFLPVTSDGCVLLLDDTELEFSSSLSQYCNSIEMFVTTTQTFASISDASSSCTTVLSGVNEPHQLIITTTKGKPSIPWTKVKCVLWFVGFTTNNEPVDEEGRVHKIFESLAIRLLADTLYDVPVILTMNNIEFANLEVERLGRESFFFLSESFPFDESTFGVFYKRHIHSKPMTVSKPISYVFYLHPPSDIQFGDYSAVLCDKLYNQQ